MKRFCVVCGKELEISLDDNNRVVSGEGYWSFSKPKQGADFEPKTIEEQKEYWECEKCMEDED